MTDRRPDQTDGPDHSATLRLDRKLTGPDPTPPQQRVSVEDATAVAGPDGQGAAAAPAPAGSGGSDATAGDPAAARPADPPAPIRDERTVNLTKNDLQTVPVDPPARSPWAPAPRAGQPTAHYPGAGPGPEGYRPAPSPWTAAQQQPLPPWPTPEQAPGQPPSWGSTRAMPRPPMSPPLPPPRGRGPLPLIVFGVLAALIIAGGAWALISLAAGSSPFGPRGVDPQAGGPSISTDAPLPSNPVLPPTAAPDPNDTAPTDGPSGQVVVSWTIDGVGYRAALTTTGASGSAVVTYTDPNPPGAVRTVRQDLTFASSEGQRAYVGSSPTDADTGQLSSTYSPDIFMLATNPNGDAYIDRVCDTAGRCGPATME